MEIKSDLTVAQAHATNFSSKGATLSSLGEVTKDELTTVAGNTKANEALETAKEVREKLSEFMDSMSSNIHSVASEFQVVDDSQAQSIHARPL